MMTAQVNDGEGLVINEENLVAAKEDLITAAGRYAIKMIAEN